MRIFVGFILAFIIGVACARLAIPLPAPPSIFGACLVLATTCGYLFIDLLLKKK